MAIISHRTSVNVADIDARDAIQIKTHGLRAIVADASADQNASGEAVYIWNAQTRSWTMENADQETAQKVLEQLQADVEVLKGASNSSDTTASELSENGYQRLGTGLVLQWGKIDDNDVYGDVTFPMEFDNQCFNVTTTLLCGTVAEKAPTVDNLTTTGFRWYKPTTDDNLFWYAIGF